MNPTLKTEVWWYFPDEKTLEFVVRAQIFDTMIYRLLGGVPCFVIIKNEEYEEDN